MALARTVASVLVSSAALLGCTALLGSFEVSDSQTPGEGEGGGTDGPIGTTEGGAADGPVDAAAALLKCTVSNNNVRTLDVARPSSGGGNNGPLQFEQPSVFRLSDTQVRVVARPNHSAGFIVYDFNPRNGGPAVNVLDVPLRSNLYAVHRLPNAIAALGIGAGGGGANQQRLEVHRIADSAFVDQIIPLTAPGVVDGTSPPNTNGPRADFVPIGNVAQPEFFYTFSKAVSEVGPFELRVGRAVGGSFVGPNLIYSSNDKTDPAASSALFVAASRVFMPLANENNGPPTTSDKILATPDNATGGMATPRSIGAPGGKPNIFLAGGPAAGASNAYNAAYLEVDIASTTAPLTYRLGPIGPLKLATFTAADIPVAFTFDSVTRLPSDGGNASWSEDNFLSIGRGQGVPGLNFLWYDAETRLLRANQTGPDAMLKDRPNVRRAAVAFSSKPTAVFTTFDLVWTENTTLGDGSMTETLFYSDVVCVR